MNKNKLALEIVRDLHHLTKSIEDFLQSMEGEKSVEVPVTSTETTSQKIEQITLEQVRAVLAAKSQSGKQQEVKALIQKYGAEKLTALDKACYKDLLKEAEEL